MNTLQVTTTKKTGFFAHVFEFFKEDDSFMSDIWLTVGAFTLAGVMLGIAFAAGTMIYLRLIHVL